MRFIFSIAMTNLKIFIADADSMMKSFESLTIFNCLAFVLSARAL